jgi:hypothetical protein
LFDRLCLCVIDPFGTWNFSEKTFCDGSLFNWFLFDGYTRWCSKVQRPQVFTDLYFFTGDFLANFFSAYVEINEIIAFCLGAH